MVHYEGAKIDARPKERRTMRAVVYGHQGHSRANPRLRGPLRAYRETVGWLLAFKPLPASD